MSSSLGNLDQVLNKKTSRMQRLSIMVPVKESVVMISCWRLTNDETVR